MKVKIISANDNSWYAHLINEDFNVDREDENHYYLGESNRFSVLKSDCEVIIPSNHTKAIQMLASTEGKSKEQVELVESLLNDIASLNEKLSFFNQSLKL